MRTVFVLAAMVAAAHGGSLYRWKWDSNWLNNANWNSGQAPLDGPFTVRFPPEFSSFNDGLGGAVYLGPTNCASGAPHCNAAGQNRGSRDNRGAQGFRQSARVHRLVMPGSGKVKFSPDFRLKFMTNVAAADERWSTFKMARKEFTDWQCSYNWVELRDLDDDVPSDVRTSSISTWETASSPPCEDDAVYFPKRSAFLVNVPSDTFVSAIYMGNPVNPTITSLAVRDLPTAIDFENQFASTGATAAFTASSFTPRNCPSQCPDRTSNIASEDECARLCMDTCPGLSESCRRSRCPRVDAIEDLQDALEEEGSCSVPLYASLSIMPYIDSPFFTADVPTRTRSAFQDAADSIVAMADDIESIDVIRVIDGEVNMHVTGELPKAQDACLRDFQAQIDNENCLLTQALPWFQSSPGSSNSEYAVRKITPLLNLFGSRLTCDNYVARGDFSAGHCMCTADGVCGYEAAIEAGLECYRMYGGLCEDVSDWDYVFTMRTSSFVTITEADMRDIVEAQACADTLCGIAPGGLTVSMEPSRATVWVTLRSAWEADRSLIRARLAEGIRRHEIVLFLEHAQAVEAGAASDFDPEEREIVPEETAPPSIGGGNTGTGGGNTGTGGGNTGTGGGNTGTGGGNTGTGGGNTGTGGGNTGTGGGNTGTGGGNTGTGGGNTGTGGGNTGTSSSSSDDSGAIVASAATATGSDSGDGVMIAAIASVALIAAVAVYVRGKNQPSGGRGTAGRNIVAFENPMYSNTKKKGTSEGLYETPAFKRGKKTNPVYGGDDDAGGYLDVDPEDDE